MKPHLLIIDDELGTRESLKAIFGRDYRLSVVENGREAYTILEQDCPDLIFLDIVLQDIDGLELFQEVHNQYPNLPVIIVSAVTAPPKVTEAIQLGAYDYITKPFDVNDIRRLVNRAMESTSLKNHYEILRDEISREFPVDGVIGKSPAFQKALADLRKAAKTDSTVLISGESGTGKELAARMLHRLSSRQDKPFVAVHCAGIPETLIESELFGHEKGAFTHALQQKPGRFDLAGSGTLFFDEVSEMSPSVQAKVLRVLEEREFVRVGGTKVIKTKARIVAASNKDLQQAVENKEFREDLYYRLAVVPIHLPPLRDRAEDIPLLAYFFLEYFKRQIALQTTDFSPETMQLLCNYRWLGNIRELKNVIERMLVLHGDETQLRPQHLPNDLQSQWPPPMEITPGMTLAEILEAQERQLIVNALKEAGGNQTQAAEKLGTTRRILKYRLEKFNIESKLYR